MENDVVCDVAKRAAKAGQRVAQTDADGSKIIEFGCVEVGAMATRDGQHLERCPAPIGADNDDAVIGEDHTTPGVDLGFDRRAEQAGSGEAIETGLLVQDLARNERETEQLTVGVHERRARLTAVVHDRLAVAQLRHRRMRLGPGGNGRHDEPGLVIGQIGPRRIVIRVHDEHLMNSGGISLGEDRTEVLNHHRLAAFEGGVEVRHHENPPRAVGPGGDKRRRFGLGTTRAERARSPGIYLDDERTCGELVRPLPPLRIDRNPSSGERVEA